MIKILRFIFYLFVTFVLFFMLLFSFDSPAITDNLKLAVPIVLLAVFLFWRLRKYQ